LIAHTDQTKHAGSDVLSVLSAGE